MKIEVGKYYRTRNGAMLRCDRPNPNGTFLMYYGDHVQVTVDTYGQVYGGFHSGFDLLRVEPKGINT